jgi:hypothetical protein
MKKLLLSIVLFLAGASAFAQTSGGPDAYGYIWRDNNDAQGPAYNWIDITALPGAVKILTLTDDNTTGFLPIGFQFPYYWYEVSQFKIGSNGYIIFTNGALASAFPAIPAATQPNDFIAGFMSDLNFTGAGNVGQCWYWTNNSDSLIVSYIHVPFYVNAAPPWTGDNTFQIILSKVDSSITFQYQDQLGSTSVGLNHDISIGIENNSGSVGLQHSLDTYPTPLTAVKFYYPPGSSFTVNDAATTFCNNADNGGLFISRNGLPFEMNAQIKNTGNQALSAFDVDFRVLNSMNLAQVQQTVTASALAPDQSEDLTATTMFNPTGAAGVYKFRTTTQLTGDATPSNNFKTLELRVVDTTVSPIMLTFTGNTPIPATGVSWTGGDGGVGVEIVPPFYPCYIQNIQFYIISNTVLADCHTLVYDNTGLDGGPGNLLDSTYLTSAEIATAGWNTVSFTNPIEVDSGSVFIGWMMDGESILLGTDTTNPISNRSYEILGSWSIYRDRETTDPMIRMNVSTTSVGIDNPVSSDNLVSGFYPSPSNGKVSLNMNLKDITEAYTFSFYNIQGQLVETKNMAVGTQHRVSFDLSKFDPGVYFCKITNGKQEFNRQLVIGK